MVKTIKKQKRTVSFRKTKTTALQNGKVKFKGAPTFTKGFEDKFAKENDGRWSLQINSGTIEMKDNKAVVLAD